MDYVLTLKWNGTTVMVATCTASMAYATADGFLRDNFAGREHADAMARQLGGLMGTIYGLTPGKSVRREYADGTGAAVAVISRPFLRDPEGSEGR